MPQREGFQSGRRSQKKWEERIECLKNHRRERSFGSETLTTFMLLLSTHCLLALRQAVHSLLFPKDLYVLGNLLGTENAEVKVEVVQPSGRSRGEEAIRHKMHRVSRGHSSGAGETLGSLLRGSGGMARRLTGVCRKAVLWDTFQQWEDTE